MSRLIEQGYISEVKNGNNFEYVLADNSYYADTDYKVMQNSASEIFVKAMKILKNGKIDLFYITEDYKPISEMRDVNPDMVLYIMSNILTSLVKARENGFLNCKNIVFTKEKIFVEPNTCKVKLTYLPLNVNEWPNEKELEDGIRSGMMHILNSMVSETNANLESFAKDICTRTMTIEDVYRRLNDNQRITEIRPVISSIKLVSMDAFNNLEITIEKDDTVIGKKEELVDAVISFNSAISRKHCRVLRENDSFYVMDEGSANGTFVNNVRLRAAEKYPLNKGDVLKLANSEFVVR